MEEVYVVRHRVLVEGVPIRRVAREMGISRNTVRRYLRGAPPGIGKPRGIPGAPVREEIKPRIEAVLEDAKRWTGGKQRLTAARLHELLRDEGREVSYTVVKELLALRWEDVDLVAGRLFVRRRIYRGKFDTPKNGKPRELPLSDDVRAALKRHRHLRGELVFCDLDGRVLKTGITRYMIIRLYRRAGLRPIGWHVLRHTFASHLAMCGAPLKSIQELMGHATIQMTMRYAHLAPEIARESVQLLDRRSNFGERGSSVAASS